jgi:hypothetical protein
MESGATGPRQPGGGGDQAREQIPHQDYYLTKPARSLITVALVLAQRASAQGSEAIDHPDGQWQKSSAREPSTPGRLHVGTVGGFKSEWWATSIRYRGRHHIGMPGRHHRNPHLWRWIGRSGPNPVRKSCASARNSVLQFKHYVLSLGRGLFGQQSSQVRCRLTDRPYPSRLLLLERFGTPLTHGHEVAPGKLGKPLLQCFGTNLPTDLLGGRKLFCHGPDIGSAAQSRHRE